ncbi:hypothetical protein [Benzoatithermus flavus]|uniref:Lipoprotein n=1 Tax=Benzoatithermus flavus TaxID=3108223 RepID=A0ABU8XT84_9PROT
MRASFGGAVAFAATFAITLSSCNAEANEVDPLVLAACMQNNTTPEDESIFRNMLIYALQDDTERLKNELGKIIVSFARLATVDCKVPPDRLGDKAIQRAFNMYGGNMGRLVMERAFAKIRDR